MPFDTSTKLYSLLAERITVPIYNKKGLTQLVSNLYFQYGGARGIRTLAPVTRSTSLAGKPLEPLEYYSNCQMPLHFTIIKNKCQAQLLNLSENNRGLIFFINYFNCNIFI